MSYYILAVCCLWSIGCTNGNPEDGSESVAVMDTIITESMDTIVTFDPATYEETTSIVPTYDTVIVERKQ